MSQGEIWRNSLIVRGKQDRQQKKKKKGIKQERGEKHKKKERKI